MVDHYIKGSSPTYRDPDGANLPSARFQVASPGGQGITGGEAIIWDATPDWDDIGFPSDFSDSGAFIFAAAGDYLIVAYVELEGPGGTFTDDTGAAVLELETTGDPGNLVDEEQSTLVSHDTGPKLSLSAVHRFSVTGEFWVRVGLDGPAGATIVAASVSITKLRSIAAL